MVFFAIWWGWLNFTWFASAYDSDDVPYHLLVLLQMGGVLILAAGVPAAFEHQDFFGITLGYFVMRIGLVAQWVRGAVENPDGRTTATRCVVGVAVVQSFSRSGFRDCCYRRMPVASGGPSIWRSAC
jgi:low temperature requirement protein LtrA